MWGSNRSFSPFFCCLFAISSLLQRREGRFLGLTMIGKYRSGARMELPCFEELPSLLQGCPVINSANDRYLRRWTLVSLAPLLLQICTIRSFSRPHRQHGSYPSLQPLTTVKAKRLPRFKATTASRSRQRSPHTAPTSHPMAQRTFCFSSSETTQQEATQSKSAQPADEPLATRSNPTSGASAPDEL